MRDRKRQQIAGLGLFAGCSGAEIDWIARVADVVDLPAGRVLVEAGSRTREFFVVLGGGLSVRAGGGDVPILPGAYTGHRGLIEQRPHPHTIRTLAPTRLLVFTPGAFSGMLHRVPSVARTISAELVARLRDAGQSPRRLRAVS